MEIHKFKKIILFCLVLHKSCYYKRNMAKNRAEVIIFNGKEWLNEKHIERQLKHSNLPLITRQYSSELRKQRQELQACGKYQPFRRFLRKDFVIQIITDCRKTPAVNCKTKLGFNQQDPIMTQGQSNCQRSRQYFQLEKYFYSIMF